MNADPAWVIKALNHPVRRRILRYASKESTVSATQLSRELNVSVSNAVYHVRVLVELGALRLVDVKRVRGAKESFYRSNLDDQGRWVQAALKATRAKDEAGA